MTADYKKLFECVRKETGIEAFEPDEGGLVSVCVEGRYNLNIQAVDSTGRMLCFVEVAQISPDAPAAVYRDLLAAGLFGAETAGGYFALEKASGTVVYNYFFDIAAAAENVREFVATLEAILQMCDVWAERIRSLTDGGAEDGIDVRRQGMILA